jgi:hypothetical protein
MTPVLDRVLSSTYGSSLSNDFFGFAKRVYTREWSTHLSDTAKIHPYSPVATYSAYPVNGSSSQQPSISLPHYSFAYYTFKAATGVPSLTITVAKSAGIQTAAFRKSSGRITEIAANAGGGSYTDSAFNSADEVVLLIANTSGIYEGANTNFSTDGSTAPVTPQPAVSGSSTKGVLYRHRRIRQLPASAGAAAAELSRSIPAYQCRWPGVCGVLLSHQSACGRFYRPAYRSSRHDPSGSDSAYSRCCLSVGGRFSSAPDGIGTSAVSASPQNCPPQS